MDARRRRGMLVAAGLLVIALAAGVTGVAVAQSSDGRDEPRARQVDDVDVEVEQPSSVTVPPERAGSEVDEGATLQGLARITADQAKAAAIAAVPGNATQVELDDRDGNVVYVVEVAGTDGRSAELEIDAGNGTVLSRDTEAEGADAAESEADEQREEANEPPETDDAPEAPEAPEPGDD